MVTMAFDEDGVLDALTDHGTQMAEIVHDVAPDADLVAMTFADDQFAEAVAWLRARVADDLRTRMGRELPRGLMEQERRDAEERVRIFGAEPAEVLQDTDIQVRER